MSQGRRMRMRTHRDSAMMAPAQEISPAEMELFKKKAQELHTQRQIKELEELFKEWGRSSAVNKRVIETNIMLYYPKFDKQLLRSNKPLYIFMKTLYDEPLEW